MIFFWQSIDQASWNPVDDEPVMAISAHGGGGWGGASPEAVAAE